MSQRRLYARKPTIATTLAFLALLLAPAAAQAGAGAGTSVLFPSTVTVGDTNQPASLTLVNLNTGGESALTNTVCNISDPNPPCGGVGIRLVPTCKLISIGQCQPAGADPGVFAVSSTATGRVGTACAGLIFNVTANGDSFGSVTFAPQGGAHVTLMGFGATCVIDFTFNVLKSPTGDQNPGLPGTQTTQATDHAQFVGTAPANPVALNSGAQGTSTGTTVERAQPAITTNASAGVAIGGQLTDQATVTGLVNPVAGGVVTFRLYPPSDATCTGTPVLTSVKVLVLNGSIGTATSDGHAPTAAGIYRWVASYGGDANNLPVAGTCGAATETRTVTVPCTPPPGTPPPGGTVCSVTTPPPPPPSTPDCTTPPGPAPAGGVLCARGTAAIRGRTGCQGSPFNVVVSGRQIARVVFTLDGKVIRTLTKPNSASRFKLAINPRSLRRGVHRVVAKTTFTKSSGTRARSLRVTFSRCARRAAAPAFTG
jgi:hypothetical protein